MEIIVLLLVIGGFLWWRSNRKTGRKEPPAAPPKPAPRSRQKAPRQTAASRPAASLRTATVPPPPPSGIGAPTPATVRAGESVWIPLGRNVDVAGYSLPGGVYVGRSLPALARGDVEPALINPQLKVDRNRPDIAGQSMDYWPSYTRISAQARAAYLSWLAAGRPGGAALGYVFLWFYGVERRILVDLTQSQAAAAEAPALIGEVERLLSLYGDNHSFRGYASNFLGAARLIVGSADPDSITPPKQRAGWDFPVDVKLGLGNLVADGKPLPPEWALAWVVCHPEVRLRTPATRCVEEFAKLFAIRYRQHFGDGLKVRPNKTRLQVDYYPASASFGGSVSLSVGELPDVTRLSAPLTKLLPIAEAATADLDSYSRHLGRGGDPDSLAAQALLPAALVDSGPARDLLDALTARLDGQQSATIDAAGLVDAWPSSTPGKLTKKEATGLADLLASAGIGIEPDVRFSGANLSKVQHAVLFRLPAGGDHALTDRFTAATVLLHVAAAVATANGTVTDEEERHLEEHLESSLRLDELEQRRLRAHLQWLLTERPTLAGMKKRLEVLNDAQRRQLGQFLIGVAGADGHVDRDELKVLGKLYPMLGLDPDSLYTDVHALTAAGDAPVTVMDAEASIDHAIPPPPQRQADPAAAGVILAADKVNAIMAETAAVAAALGTVFEDPVAAEAANEEVDESPTAETAADGRIAGLDEAHSTLLVRLAERPMWPRAEFDEFARRLGLMPAGAVETINEASFAACDEPMLEGEDPIEVNTYAAEELLA